MPEASTLTLREYVIYTAKLLGYRLVLPEGKNYHSVLAPDGSVISPDYVRVNSLCNQFVLNHAKQVLGQDLALGWEAARRVVQSAKGYAKNTRP